MDVTFAETISHCWMMNTGHTWHKLDVQSLDVVLGSFVISWMSHFLLTTPGRLHNTIYNFSPFLDNGSECGSLESQSLRNGFVTIPRLTDVNGFGSQLFLTFFRYIFVAYCTFSERSFQHELKKCNAFSQ